MKIFSIIFPILISINSLFGQYVQKNIIQKKPSYTSDSEIIYAHFLSDENLIICSRGNKTPFKFEIAQFDGSQINIKKDITNEFYIKSNGKIKMLAIQPLKGKDFFYARPLGLGVVKVIDKNGNVLKTFDRSFGTVFSKLSDEEKVKINKVHKENKQAARSSSYFSAGNLSDFGMGNNFIQPNSSNSGIYGYLHNCINGKMDFSLIPYTELKSGGEIDDNIYNQTEIPFLTENNGIVDYERKTLYSTESEGSSIQQKFKHYFVKKDYSSIHVKKSFFGRGNNQSIWTYTINKVDNIAYVGYEDGVVDSYDLNTTEENAPLLNRLNRIYSRPDFRFIKIEYLNGTDYLLCAKTPNKIAEEKSTLGSLVQTLNKIPRIDYSPSVFIDIYDNKTSNLLYSFESKDKVWAFDKEYLANMEFSPNGMYVLGVGIKGGKSTLIIWKIKE